MKKIYLICAVIAWSIQVNAQWSITGNGSTNSGTNFLGTTDTAALVFKTNNTERFRLTGSGSFGIGVIPGAKFEVGNMIRASGVAQANIVSPSSGKGIEHFYDTTRDTGYMQVYDRSASVYLPFELRSSRFTFKSSTKAIVLDHLGVQSEYPGATGIPASVLLTSAAGRNLHLAGDGSGAAGNGTGISYHRGSAIWSIALRIVNTSGGAYGNLLLMQDGGSVAIGTTCAPPTGYRMAVKGKIMCEEMKVKLADGSGCWPDYVFNKQYSLMPIGELEQFILENKHLPNIPAAEEIENEGIEVGQMVTKQMEKIEELTLYLIELKKENEHLKQESAEVKKRLDAMEVLLKK